MTVAHRRLLTVVEHGNTRSLSTSPSSAQHDTLPCHMPLPAWPSLTSSVITNAPASFVPPPPSPLATPPGPPLPLHLARPPCPCMQSHPRSRHLRPPRNHPPHAPPHPPTRHPPNLPARCRHVRPLLRDHCWRTCRNIRRVPHRRRRARYWPAVQASAGTLWPLPAAAVGAAAGAAAAVGGPSRAAAPPPACDAR